MNAKTQARRLELYKLVDKQNAIILDLHKQIAKAQEQVAIAQAQIADIDATTS